MADYDRMLEREWEAYHGGEDAPAEAGEVCDACGDRFPETEGIWMDYKIESGAAKGKNEHVFMCFECLA